jgi:outer membrane lipoprotein-sorting protein
MKMPVLKNIFLVLVCSLGIGSAVAQELSPKEIVQKANDLRIGNSSKGEITMTVIRPTWTREVSLKSWSMGENYYMILITGPAEDKGQSFLKRKNEMWNWQPSISRIIRIPPSMMGQSWMGSDFTNNDLVDKNSIVDDYVQTLQGSENVSGYDCYKIQLIPKPESAVVWGKIVVWISKKQYFLLKAEYYDEDGGLVNTETLSDVRRFGDREMPAKLMMVPANEPGNKTILEFKNLQFNIPMKQDFFSQENMKSLR